MKNQLLFRYGNMLTVPLTEKHGLNLDIPEEENRSLGKQGFGMSNFVFMSARRGSNSYVSEHDTKINKS